MARKVVSEPFVLEDPDGWARFECEECDKQLKVGDEVVMVPICGGWLAPAEAGSRPPRTATAASVDVGTDSTS